MVVMSLLVWLPWCFPNTTHGKCIRETGTRSQTDAPGWAEATCRAQKHVSKVWTWALHHCSDSMNCSISIQSFQRKQLPAINIMNSHGFCKVLYGLIIHLLFISNSSRGLVSRHTQRLWLPLYGSISVSRREADKLLTVTRESDCVITAGSRLNHTNRWILGTRGSCSSQIF